MSDREKVKRFWINTQQYVDSQGPYVNYEDYEVLVGLVNDLVRAGDYIHGRDSSGCHQDCPWISARNRAEKFLFKGTSNQKGQP